MSNSDSIGDGPNYAQQEVDRKIGEINTAGIRKWEEKREPSEGDVRFDTTDNETKVFIGGSWVRMANAASENTTKKITEGTLKGISINTDPIVYSSGSTGISSGGMTWVPTTTTTPTTTTWPSTGAGIMVLPEELKPVEQKKEPKKIVDFPRRVTRKVVIGFVEDDDSIVWGAKLNILDFHIDFDNQDGEGRITLVTDIEDAEEEPKK